MSDDAIQDLIDRCECYGNADARDRAQAQHTANRNVIASLKSSLEGRAAEVAQLQARLEVVAAVEQLGLSPEVQAHLLAIREELEAVYAGALSGTRARAEAAEAKVARLESAIADHVIDEAMTWRDDMPMPLGKVNS